MKKGKRGTARWNMQKANCRTTIEWIGKRVTGEEFKAALKAAGYTQAAFAQLMGMHRETIGKQSFTTPMAFEGKNCAKYFCNSR